MMSLWRLTPIASPDDARWQDREVWSEVIVEAPTAALARRYAADWELASGTPPIGNESPSPRSGFEDEKLYWVRRVSPGPGDMLSRYGEPASRVKRAVVAGATAEGAS